MYRTGLVIQDLIDAGVRLWYYYADEEVTIDGAVDKFLVAARTFAAELEREKVAQSVHEHLQVKARAGLNVGGRVFGYDNHKVREGDRRRRVEYRINEAEANIIREIFGRYAEGEGLRRLAKDLNARGIGSPRAGKRGTGSWSPSVIHAMLRRERYRGILVWGRKGKTYKGGTRVHVDREQRDWTSAEMPGPRIVSEELWAAVQARIGQSERFGPLATGAGPLPRCSCPGSRAVRSVAVR
jgi:site-specific DNA recombinase